MKTNHKTVRLEFAKLHVVKPQSFWENVLWTDQTKLELSVISSMFTDAKMKHIKIRTLSLLWNMEEVLLCSGSALLHLEQGVWNLCRSNEIS